MSIVYRDKSSSVLYNLCIVYSSLYIPVKQCTNYYTKPSVLYTT